MNLWPSIIITILIVIVIIIRQTAQDKTAAENKRAVAGKAQFDFDTLIVTKRGPEIRPCLEIWDDRDMHLSTTPDQYVYTSVSHGGVTVGGVDKIKGKTTVKWGKKTGKATIFYKYNETSSNGHLSTGAVYKIKLTPGDLEKAKHHPVLKQCVGKGKGVCSFDDESDLSLLYLERRNLTRGQCEKIIDWLSGKD